MKCSMLKPQYRNKKCHSVGKSMRYFCRDLEFGSPHPHRVCQLQEHLTCLVSPQAPRLMWIYPYKYTQKNITTSYKTRHCPLLRHLFLSLFLWLSVCLCLSLSLPLFLSLSGSLTVNTELQSRGWSCDGWPAQDVIQGVAQGKKRTRWHLFKFFEISVT